MILDTRNVHVAAGVPASTSGHGPAERVPGRKPGLAVDVLGVVIAVVVLAANDNAADSIVLDQAAEHAGGTVREALVDQGFTNQVIPHGAGLGVDVEIVARDFPDKGSVPQPKRWRAEQTYGILIRHRRLVRDCEHRPPPASPGR